MDLPVVHSQSYTKNTIWYWNGIDSQTLFKENNKDPVRKHQLEKYGFLDTSNPIIYKFNQDGFRCKNFDNRDSIIALGCSYTMGVGLHEENVWPSIVSQQLKLTVWNLGIGGASMDTCFRMLNHYITKLNTKCVLVLGPPRQRFELHVEDGIKCLIPASIQHPMQEHWYRNETNGDLNYYKNCLAIQQLCQQHGKKCVIGYAPDLLVKKNPSDLWPGARDLLHAGASEQRSCAGYFLKSI
jgi:hypothetical protein